MNIAVRSFISGSSTCICRSKRPARSSALSRISALLVAAKIITPEFDANPSISVSNWFSVFSRSSFAPKFGFLPLALPIASISSINTIQGAFSLACLKRSRTLDAPTPTNISTKSEPEIEKNGTLASPATALASNVFPVPGGPISKAPLGILPPRSVYFFGFLRNSTISITSTLASSNPATSVKSILTVVSLSKIFAFDLPTLKIFPAPPGPPPAPLILRKIISHITTRIASGKSQVNSSPNRSLRLCARGYILSFSFMLACASSSILRKTSTEGKS
ncbi:hypothetical protein ES708_18980 [subsurface metagenome]